MDDAVAGLRTLVLDHPSTGPRPTLESHLNQTTTTSPSSSNNQPRSGQAYDEKRTITDLPSEILGAIFKHVFLASRCRASHMAVLEAAEDDPSLLGPQGTMKVVAPPWYNMENEVYKPCYTRWRKEDPLSQSIFPYALARVCRAWQDVLSLYPAFWTRLVVLTDVGSPLADLKTQISWSQKLNFELFITRRNPPRGDVVHQSETRCVQTAMKMLAHHLHRCTGLTIDVGFRSALPYLPNDFLRLAPRIRSLKVASHKNDCLEPRVPLVSAQSAALSRGPRLEELLVDANNFRRIFPMSGKLKCHNLRSLTVVHFGGLERGRHRFSMPTFLRALSQLDVLLRLRIMNIDFAPVVKTGSTPSYHFDALNHLDLRCLSGEAVRDVLSCSTYSGLEKFFIVGCSLTGVKNCTFPFTVELTMGHITNLDSTTDLRRLFGGWYGMVLTLENCPQIAHSICTLMGTINETGGDLYCPHMRCLYVIDCALSVAAQQALKSSVRIRNDPYVYCDSEDNVVFPEFSELEESEFIYDIYVNGLGLPLPRAAIADFETLVPKFTWDTNLVVSEPEDLPFTVDEIFSSM